MNNQPEPTAFGEEGHSPSSPNRVRLTGWLLLAAGVAVGVLAAALWMGGGERVPADAPEAFDVTDSIVTAQTEPAPESPTPPSSIPVTEEAPAPGSIPATPAPSVPSDAEDLEEGEGTADQEVGWGIGVRSGRLADLVDEEQLRPVRIIIPSLDVDAPIDVVGYDRRKDEMEIPRSAERAGWYEFSPSPGEAGSSVISAHVDWGGEKGAFFDLRKTEANALIIVEYEDGSRRQFSASSRNSYDKDELPVDDLFRRDGRPTLTLITCGGAFNPSISSYEDNVVVEAIEVPISFSG